MYTVYMQLLIILMLHGQSHHWGRPLLISIIRTNLKDSLPNHNVDFTNLYDSVAIATPVSQRSGSFTEQEAS